MCVYVLELKWIMNLLQYLHSLSPIQIVISSNLYFNTMYMYLRLSILSATYN